MPRIDSEAPTARAAKGVLGARRLDTTVPYHVAKQISLSARGVDLCATSERPAFDHLSKSCGTGVAGLGTIPDLFVATKNLLRGCLYACDATSF